MTPTRHLKYVLTEHFFLLLMGFGLVLVLNVFLLNLMGVSINLYDLRRLAQLGLMGFITMIGLLYWPLHAEIQTFWQALPRWLRLLGWLFLFLGFLSACHARLPRYAFLQWGHDVLLGFDTLVVAALIRRQGRNGWQYLWSCIFVSIAVLLATHQSIYYYLTQVAASISDIPSSYFVNPTYVIHRFLAQVITWTWPILILPLCIKDSDWRWRLLQVLTLIVASGWWCTAILNQSRALMLEWLVLLVVMPLIFRRVGWRFVRWQILTAGLGFIWFYVQYVLLFPVFFHVISGHELIRQTDSYLGGERFTLYRVALLQMWHHPLLGLGPMFYADLAGALGLENAHPHNILLNLGAEWGVPAMMIFALFWGWSFWVAMRLGIKSVAMEKSDNDTVVKMVFFAAFCTASLHAMVSGILIMPASQTLFIFLVAGFIVVFTSDQVTSPQCITKLKRGLWLGLVVFSLIAVINGIAPFWGYWNQSLADYQKQSGQMILKPNYWQQGFINYWPQNS